MRKLLVLGMSLIAFSIAPAASATDPLSLVPPVDSQPQHGTTIPLLTGGSITSYDAVNNGASGGEGTAEAAGWYGHFKLKGILKVNYLTRSDSGSLFRTWEELCVTEEHGENMMGTVQLSVSCRGSPSGHVVTGEELGWPVDIVYCFEAYLYSHDFIWGYDEGYAGWDSEAECETRAI